MSTPAVAPPPDDGALLDVLATIRARGAIGEASLSRAVAHAAGFAEQIEADATVVDLGSGGGLPGLVIAVYRPDLHLTLVERRTARADLLRRAVAALQLGERVEVRAVDVRELATTHRVFDAVTARSFAAPLVLARLAAPLCRPGGLAVVSEPPPPSTPSEASNRWPPASLARLGWDDLGVVGSLRRLRRR